MRDIEFDSVKTLRRWVDAGENALCGYGDPAWMRDAPC